jgi:hypothetical protein
MPRTPAAVCRAAKVPVDALCVVVDIDVRVIVRVLTRVMNLVAVLVRGDRVTECVVVKPPASAAAGCSVVVLARGVTVIDRVTYIDRVTVVDLTEVAVLVETEVTSRVAVAQLEV